MALRGCGGVLSPDLFIVYRSGSGPGAKLTMLVNEEGVVHCNNGPARHLSDPQIIEARTIQEDLEEPAAKHESLPAEPGSVLSYYLRDANGTVRFSDNSSASADGDAQARGLRADGGPGRVRAAATGGLSGARVQDARRAPSAEVHLAV